MKMHKFYLKDDYCFNNVFFNEGFYYGMFVDTSFSKIKLFQNGDWWKLPASWFDLDKTIYK